MDYSPTPPPLTSYIEISPTYVYVDSKDSTTYETGIGITSMKYYKNR
jgi:hypothetical protein